MNNTDFDFFAKRPTQLFASIPNTNIEKGEYIKQGTKFKKLEDNVEWIKVATESSKIGYVRAHHTAKLSRQNLQLEENTKEFTFTPIGKKMKVFFINVCRFF